MVATNLKLIKTLKRNTYNDFRPVSNRFDPSEIQIVG